MCDTVLCSPRKPPVTDDFRQKEGGYARRKCDKARAHQFVHLDIPLQNLPEEGLVARGFQGRSGDSGTPNPPKAFHVVPARTCRRHPFQPPVSALIASLETPLRPPLLWVGEGGGDGHLRHLKDMTERP